MRPDTSRWRDQDQYDFYDGLSVEGVAWECLRRNTAYQASFDALIAQESQQLPFPKEAQRHWGLRFPRGSRLLRTRPAGHLVAACQSSGTDAWGCTRSSPSITVHGIRRTA